MVKLFVANYSSGDWDDYSDRQVFVSHDKQLVENWVEKFNRILVRWKEYYSQYGENVHEFCEDCKLTLKEEVEDYRIILRFYQLRDINEAFITEIELR